jgi:hypothetical protein
MKLPRFGLVYAQVIALQALLLAGSWSLWSRTYASAAPLAPQPIARKVIVHGVTFAADGVSIAAEALPLLHETAEATSEDAPITLVVTGDSRVPTGSDDVSRLANAVRDFLIEHGVVASRVHLSPADSACRLAVGPSRPCVAFDVG